MPKYILHGGNTSTPVKTNTDFFKEITSSLADGDNILIIYFARKEEDYNRCFEQDILNFKKVAPNKKLNLTIANQENFLEQLKQANAVYIRGGKEKLNLINTIKKYPEFKNLTNNMEVVAGCSAGAYALSTYFYSTSLNGLHKGLGILPIAVHCHHKGEEEIEEELKNVSEDYSLSVILLDECEFEVIG